MSATVVAEPTAETVVEAPTARSLEVPTTLPVSSLSKSSIELFERCPEAWKRKYVDDVREPQNGSMSAGKAIGAALSAYFQEKREGRESSLNDVDERFVDELDTELKEAKLKDDEDAVRIREGGREALRIYLETIAPSLNPIATERRMRLRFPGAEWSVVGYVDLEVDDGRVIDFKLKKPGGHHISTADAVNDIQASLYQLGRALEGAPATGFEFHSGLSHEPKSGERWRIVPAPRTDRQLEQFQARIALVARQIARAVETGDWGYRTDSWFCGPGYCPNFARCPAGGLR